MGEIDERVYELGEAAVACGLTQGQVIDDIKKAIEATERSVAGEAIENKPDKWWPSFFKFYSAIVVDRFQSKCGVSRDNKVLTIIWLEYFEPLWLAGCNYTKELTVQKIRGKYTELAHQFSHGETLTGEDMDKLKQYCSGIADNLDKVLSLEIARSKTAQRKALSMTFHLDIAIDDIPKSDVSDAQILDEMCKMQSGFMVTRLARGKGLSQAEINILQYKTNPFYSGAFRVTETANENEIDKWLKHPMVNRLLPDHFVMSMAAQTPVPVNMMENILRKLLQENFEECWKEAEDRIRAEKQNNK